MKIVRGASKVTSVKKRLSLFTAILFGFVALGLSPAYAVDERVIDVVAVTWAGAGAPAGDVNVVAKVIDSDVNADWKKFTTLYGDTKDRTVSFVSGKVLTEPISLVSKMACSGFAASEFLSSIRPEAYKRLGISDYSKRYLVVVAPKAGCVWSGRAPLGGPKSVSGVLVLHDSASSYVITHELGHTFGLGHSNFLRCDNAANDGAWSDICKAVEYGGTIDVMGNIDTTSPLNTYHQWRMGYLDDSQIKQVWQSEVVNLAPSDFANGIRAIYIRDGKAAYWIEYRRKLDGVGYKPGLAIYRLDPPPITSIVSPNPEDAAAAEFGATLGTDLWMLNLDTYQYRDSRSVGGSMTALTATTYSGNISFSAVASETGAAVTIKRKSDGMAPPVPLVVAFEQWRSPGMTIVQAGYEGTDTAITAFEAQVDGVVKSVKSSDVENWYPTYLNPFVAPKTVYLRDLPEGTYNFALRAIDMAGNKSDWSKTQKVTVDLGRPTATNDFNFVSATGNQVTVAWSGAKDAGSGLCQTNLVSPDGLIVQTSTAKAAPTLKVTNGQTLSATAQVFDCIGNGVSGDLSVTNKYTPADKSSRTGKWTSAGTSYPTGSLKCTGKCTASFSASGRFDVISGTGAAVVSAGSKVLAKIADSKVAKLRVAASVDLGSNKQVLRLTGSNFVLVAINSINATFANTVNLDRAAAVVDSSLTDTKQAALAKFGFAQTDFSQEWTVLPMGGGTTTDDPTLDLCNGKFASESDRLERRQVVVSKPRSPYAFLSSEVVRYSSVAAAQVAQKELVKVLAQCQVDKGYKDATGTLVPYSFGEIKNIPAGVVGEGSRVFVRATIDSGANARQLLGFYQFNGAIFTGLYVLNASEVAYTDAQVATWLQVAATMASRLKG
jgi:hypothetical protein